MYAFALWDGRSRKGLLVRDPIGIKPLFFAVDRDGRLRFGSEVKAILACAGDDHPLDETSLHLLMNFRYLPGNRTMFRGVSQLSPGTVLEWNGEGPVNEMPIPDPPVAQDRPVLDALAESVRYHLTADVEVGAYLSGGVDSAMVVALARRSGSIRTFTLDAGDDPAEASNASASAAFLGVENLQVEIDRKPSDTLADLIAHLEVPKVNSWQILELARFAARHTKVALSGLGGDELFYGYNAHRIMHWASRLSRLGPAALSSAAGHAVALLARALPGPPWSEGERAGRMLASLGNWPRVYGLLRNVWDDRDRRSWVYGPRMLDADLPDAFETLETLWPHHPDPVTAMADYEWRQKMVNDLLWQEDRCSMAVGLEVRVPFLDLRLRSQVHLLGRERLMPGGKRKGYMHELARPLLGDQILRRPKSGFQVDAASFFSRQLSELADRSLDPASVRSAGLFNPGFIEEIRSRSPRKRLRWHYFMLYLMLGSHLWLDRFEGRP
jgi:asparagine synthase (glutamine-hydrolysing)